MNVGNVSFGSGFLQYGRKYINPDQIVKIEPWVDTKDTLVSYSNNVCAGRGGTPICNEIIHNVDADSFARKAQKAKNSNEIVSLISD